VSGALSFFFAPKVQAQLERHTSGRYRVRLGVESVGPARAIMALDESGKMVGVLVFDLVNSGRTMRSWMTFVDDAWRGVGMALTLWDLALQRRRVRSVRVTVISDNGLALVRSLAERHPAVRFDVRESAGRKLRAKRAAG
jgi:hypothetical protein